MRKVDRDGKIIVHGRRYVRIPDGPFVPLLEGTILWSREHLVYLFIPDLLDSTCCVVNFQIMYKQDDADLVAYNYIREKVKRKKNGKRVVRSDGTEWGEEGDGSEEEQGRGGVGEDNAE